MTKTKLIYWFQEVSIKDVPLVGGKNAALGEMYSELTPLGVRIPNGFAISADAYRYFLETNGFDRKIKQILQGINTHNIADLARRGKLIRDLIVSGKFPLDLGKQIIASYNELSKFYKTQNVDVAVRSSATAEDLPGASFAGQQETFLNIRGAKQLMIAVRKCFASLFTDRAISYRVDKGFSVKGGSASGGNPSKIALSVGIQKMVRSDKSCSGVAFTIDTETGFDKVISITGIYGLGELIVQGAVIPDEFIVFKPSLEKGFYPIISHALGKKNIKLVYSSGQKSTKTVPVSKKDKNVFVLLDKEIRELAVQCLKIEQHFSKKHKKYTPMDIEWAKDGVTNQLFIVQARPETIHAGKKEIVYEEYALRVKPGSPILVGIAVGTKIANGTVRVIKNVKDIATFKKGEILVTEITDPDWEPVMKIASAIVTDKGGRTSHAAIVSRELGVPCMVGTGNATRLLKTGDDITIDCSSGEIGKIYRTLLPFRVMRHSLKHLPNPGVKIALNIGSPDEAFRYHALPVSGVGLGRLEFIIASHIRIHPKALLDYAKLKKGLVKIPYHPQSEIASFVRKIDALTKGYEDKTQYYVDKLSEGIAKIAATFYPYDAIIRFSDFKTNEYETLIAGVLYEPHEENPMIGWRGASRYYDPKFADAFALECKAIARVRNEMGFSNVIPMVPVCRTPEEGEKVLALIRKSGIKNCKVYVMAEIPSNILLADEFLKIFDGMSIGSNDLTQMIMGLDRDSGIVSHIANEKNKAVKIMIAQVIKVCNDRKKYVGICGQAPSDYPEFALFLKKAGIQAISLNPDSVIKTIMTLGKKSVET